jgi:Ala-tRNA(Pro) deacylase
MAHEDLTRMLDEGGARYELLPHAHTESASAEADALGVAQSEVGKTLVVTTPSGNVRVVLPASHRLDLRKLSELYDEGRKKLHLASEDELAREYPEFALGAVPPLGGKHTDDVVVDSRLAERESVVVEAGTHEESVRLMTQDLLRLTQAKVADICSD